MNFAQLHEALRLELLRRIEGGGLSGKLIAQQTGFKQAHISNFLRGRRLLSMHAMDIVLASQKLTVADLMAGGIATLAPTRKSLEAARETVPLVSQFAAMHEPHIIEHDVLMDVPLVRGALDNIRWRGSASRREWQRFVAIRVTAAQAEEMQPILRPHMIAVIDRHYISPADYHTGSPNLYAVNMGDRLALRYVSVRANKLILRVYSFTQAAELIEAEPGHLAVELLVGRVCHILSEV